MTATRSISVAVGVVAMALSACGGSSDSPSAGTIAATTTLAAPSTATPQATAPTETSATTAPVDATGGEINSFEQIQPAVIQIVAQGSFRDPEIGMVTGAGRGSGFIISPDGLAVTNNHVVTGAATLEVFIGGDDTKGYNATVVGVSECNDLALIQIVSRDPLPYLGWSAQPPSVGMEIFAAGFPLGDPEYTMTRGIVAKAKADGDTSWASIDYTIEHDANTQPGNSGGPIVDASGHVAAVHYAGGSITNTAQFFAISSELAQIVVDELRNGDFESLGINGSAVVDESVGLSGVWVAGTAPGSPASNAGILPGDIVTALNGLPIGSDGTMRDYCDVIRTAGDRPIHVEVLRYDSQEVLEGEINGDLPLEQVFSFADEIGDDVTVDDNPATLYGDYQTLVDDTGTMTVNVPSDWFDVDTVPLDDGSPWISASPSLDGLYSTYDVPGIVMIGGPSYASGDIPGAIDAFVTPGACGSDDGLAPYDDGYFVGQFRLLGDCGDTGAAQVIIVANANSGAGGVLIAVQMLNDADFEALDTIIASFDLFTG